MMAVLMSISAGPASALVIVGDKDHDNDHNNRFFFDRGDHRDFDRNHDGFGDASLEIGDVDNDSGDIETDNSIEIGGDNNNACLGQQQFGQTGNFTNQQGAGQFFSDADDIEFSGPEVAFGPQNETACDQDVEQASAASSGGW